MGPINIFLSRTHLHETALLKQLLTASGVPSTRVNKIYHARSEMKNKCTYLRFKHSFSGFIFCTNYN
jgi:hypothetical protein